MKINVYKITLTFFMLSLFGCETALKNENDPPHITNTNLVSSVSAPSRHELFGQMLDSEDAATAYYTLDDGPKNQPTKWTNTKTGITYIIVPDSDLRTVRENTQCRYYRATMIANDGHHKVYGTACRQPDGSWMDVEAKL